MNQNLKKAYDEYWGASTAREQDAAYHAILLFGGSDGWHQVAMRGGPTIRGRIARSLRRLALWVEERP